MRYSRRVDHLLDRISLYALRTYLERNGWRRLTPENDRWVIFRLGADRASIELVLPAQERFLDVRERISQTVLSLSQIEARSPDEICTDVVGTTSDSLLILLQIPNYKTSISVDEAPRHVKAIRNLILFSACSEVEARPNYEQPLPGSAEIMTNFEFCHTFAGSFGFEVSSLIAKPQQVDDLFEPPKSRLLIERLARGLRLLNEAVKADAPEVLTQAYENAFNARMCDAIADISIDGKVTYYLEIEWATSLLPAEDVRSFHEQIIAEPHINMVKHVSEQLKIVHPHHDRVCGPVINLHCASNPVEDNSRRIVALKVNHDKFGLIEVRMNLGPNYYLRAIEAHTKGEHLCARGQLQRKGNVWTIEAITALEVTGS